MMPARRVELYTPSRYMLRRTSHNTNMFPALHKHWLYHISRCGALMKLHIFITAKKISDVRRALDAIHRFLFRNHSFASSSATTLRVAGGNGKPKTTDTSCNQTKSRS
jgi:hypothetical protein